MYLVKSLNAYFGTNAERVAAGLSSFLAGDEFNETDTGNVYQHNGMAWVKTAVDGSGYLPLSGGTLTGGLVVNSSGGDNDTTIQGDTATKLGVFDAGLDAFQIGTTVAGAIADFRNSGIVFNNSESDRDFRIAGNGVEFGYFYDGGNNRHGFGTGSPDILVHIAGDAAVVGYLNVNTTSNPPAGNLGVIHCYGVAPGFFFYEQGTTDNNVFFVYDAGLMQFQNRTDAGGFTSSPFVFDMTSATNTFRVNSSRVGIGTDPTNVSAKLEISSTTGAVLLPRMTTTQQNALTAVNGMLIYNSTTGKFTGYAGGAWVALH